jgi:hypothetical protein
MISGDPIAIASTAAKNGHSYLPGGINGYLLSKSRRGDEKKRQH